MRAGQAARGAMVTVDASVTVTEAARALLAEEVRVVVVTEGSRVVGILTERDIVARVVSRQLPASTRVRAVMTPEVAGEASPSSRRCPHCGTAELRAVDNGQTINLLCLHCRACWHPVQGKLVRVDPEACPGCPDRAFCRFPAVGGSSYR